MHRTCPKCGYCMTCRDCEKYGCGEKETKDHTFNVNWYWNNAGRLGLSCVVTLMEMKREFLSGKVRTFNQYFI